MDIFGFVPTFGMTPSDLETALKMSASTATIGIIVGGRLGWLGARRKLSKGDFRDDFEIDFVSLTENADGTISVDFESQWEGTLLAAMRSPALAGHVSRSTKKSPGQPILLGKHHLHALMMGRIEGLLTGADARANAASAKGRPVHEEKFAFGVVYIGEDLSGDGRNDSAVTRVFVFDDQKIGDLLKDDYVKRLRASKSRHQPWILPLVKMARAAKGEGEGHGGDNRVWYTKIKTSYGAADFMSKAAA